MVSPLGAAYYDASVTTTDGERYPDIGHYGMIGDSRASALVSRDGSIDWFCVPNLDSPSLFGRLLDWERGGFFRIAPVGPYDVRRRYISDTNVLETTFVTGGGEVSLIDFMPALTEEEKRVALQPLRAVLRIVECRGGRIPMRLDYQPRPGYGRQAAHLRARGAFDVIASRGRDVVHLRSGVPLEVTGEEAWARFEAVPAERLRFSLAYAEGEPGVIVSDRYVDSTYDQTLTFWRNWSNGCTYDGPYRESVVRSALTLKLLSYAPSGAIVAAATTSLPEEIGGARNWDYRYCWLRDASFTIKAFLALGLKPEAEAFTGWLMHATRQTAPRLSPMYTLMGEPHIPERTLDDLAGYRDSTPVRVGNAASAQHQFDVYGELMDAFHTYVRDTGAVVSDDAASFVRRIADHVAKIWREPDSGIWEPRIAPQHYTHSKVMAWSALHHAAELAEDGSIRGDVARWRHEAEEIRQLVIERGFNDNRATFTQILDGDAVDAALLMLPLVGFLEPDDPKMLSTIAAIRTELSHNGFLRRYLVEDGIEGGEGAFLICNFWLAAALARGGRIDDAHGVFTTTLQAQNDLGLMAEQVDPKTLAALGNFPQAFSHIGLITAALAIREAEQSRDINPT
jgi:GH15 family glucan-1,4-alpha-glucosidase